MGQYINKLKDGTVLPKQGKAKFLIEKAGATPLSGKTFEHNMVCVVENSSFDAAGYCYNENEYKAFRDGLGGRPHTWLSVPDASSLVD